MGIYVLVILTCNYVLVILTFSQACVEVTVLSPLPTPFQLTEAGQISDCVGSLK